MSLVERIQIMVEVEVNVSHLAEQFAALTDDAQAQFLCIAAVKLGSAAGDQAFHIGRHLTGCQCSTEAGREFVREIVNAMEVPR